MDGLIAAHAMIYEEIKENQARLDACKKHHFPTFPERVEFGMKLDCSKCGGSMNAVHAFAYTQGYVAAGGNGNDIIPGWG
jgi:hypothetical protein